MISFILNNEEIRTDEPAGGTVLDLVRYHHDLKGTKIGCREGDCGACTVLVGELVNGQMRYRSMTSCLMPLANARGKHVVTIEGINPADGSLTPVQQAMVDESGTQCGFCTVGFVMSLTGFCIDDCPKTTDAAISAMDGNICRCTGYKSIERAAERIAKQLADAPESGSGTAITAGAVPEYFSSIAARLDNIIPSDSTTGVAPTVPASVGGGTDLYVQRPEHMAESEVTPLLFDERLRGIHDDGVLVTIGGSATVTDLMESSVMQAIFPDLYKHLKLVSSTPIRNMATLAGNFVNASPIGDMTVWFLALDADIELGRPTPGSERTIKLRDLYRGYKDLAKEADEIITAVRFKKPAAGFRFNFEKVSKRTYLDIATVNTAISVVMSENAAPGDAVSIVGAHVSAGGVAPIPLYLGKTSAFLKDRTVNEETIAAAIDIIGEEISPISDVRGTAEYKRLLLGQLFRAHFVELFPAANSGSATTT